MHRPFVMLFVATSCAIGTAAFAQDNEEDRFDALFGEDEAVPCNMLQDGDEEAEDCGPANATVSREGMGEADEILTMMDEIEEDQGAEETESENPEAAGKTNEPSGDDDMALSDGASTMPPPGEQGANDETGASSKASENGTALSDDLASENSNAATPDMQAQRVSLVNLNAADDLAAADVGYNNDGTFGSLADVDTVPGTSEDAVLDITLGDGLDPLADPLSPALDGINDLGAAVGAPLGDALSPVLAPIADTLP